MNKTELKNKSNIAIMNRSEIRRLEKIIELESRKVNPDLKKIEKYRGYLNRSIAISNLDIL